MPVAPPVMDEDWRVDGLSLRTVAIGMETLGGVDGIPSRRGENVANAYVRGRRWTEKTPDQRTFTLVLWTNDVDPDTGDVGGTEQARRAQVNANNQRLLQLFGQYERLLTVERELRLPGGKETRVGYVEAANGFGVEFPDDGRRWAGRVAVDLTLPDGHWWGDTELVTNIAGGAGTDTITNPGTAPATAAVITLNGPLTNPQLVNSTYDPEVLVLAGIVLDTDQVLTIDTGQFTAVLTDPDDGDSNVIGAITHSGARHWLQLAPGDNEVELTSDAGTGNVAVAFTPPYW